MARSSYAVFAAGGVLVLNAFFGPQSAAKTSAAAAAQQATQQTASSRTQTAGASSSVRVVSGAALLADFLGDPSAAIHAAARRDTTARDTTSADPLARAGAIIAGGPYRYRLDVLVATVPDPVDSHLDWAYDSYVEAIRRAYERAGYVTDRFWVPWGTVPDTARIDGVPVREAWPGVMLFRKVDPDSLRTDSIVRLRLLYLVGEVPTRGVHRPALLRALRERDTLLAASRPWVEGDSLRRHARIVGPAFSGSAYSLRAVLEAWLPDSTVADVVTGSATNLENRAILSDSATIILSAADTAPRIGFGATVHPDDALLEALYDSVLKPMHIRRDQVAILREGSTYGRNAAPSDALDPRQPTACGNAPADSGRFLEVPFPMNISRLRSEYARRPATQAQAAPGMPGSAPPEPSIPVDLSDRARPLESPPVQSELTLPMLEATLTEIGNTLARHDVKAVGVLATDVRDKLFLATEVRRRVTDAQVFTFEGNSLYLAPEHNRALRGTLVVSTYPLFLQNQWWEMPSGERNRLPFTNEGAQGVHNAVLLQLGHPGLMAEYGGESTRDGLIPKVWITAVGSRSFLPLAAVPPAPCGYVRGAILMALTKRTDTRARPEFFTLAAVGLLAVLVLGLSLVAIGPFVPRRGRAAWARLHRKPAPAAGPDGSMDTTTETTADTTTDPGSDTTLVATGSATEAATPDPIPATTAGQVRCYSLRMHGYLYRGLRIIAVGAIFGPPALLVSRALQLSDLPEAAAVRWGIRAVMAIGWIALLAQTTAVVGMLVRTWRVGEKYALGRHWPTLGRKLVWWLELLGRGAVAALGFVFLALSMRFYSQVQHIPAEDFALYLHRVAQLDGGVSPILPLLVGGIGFAVWCTWHLNRIHHLRQVTAYEAACLSQEDSRVQEALDGRGRSEERKKEDASWRTRGLSTLSPRTVEAVGEVRSRLYLLVPNLRGLVLMAVILALACILARYLRPPLEMMAGTTVFDGLLRLLIVGSLVGTAWAVYRLLAVWRALQRCLVEMGTTPLVTAFDRLPAHVSQLTRLTLIGAPSCQILSSTTAAQRRHLERLTTYAQKDLEQLDLVDDKKALPTAIMAFAGCGETFRTGRRPCGEVDQIARPYAALDGVLREFWAEEPETPQIDALAAEVKKGGAAVPETGIIIRRSYPDRMRLWLRAAEEFAAVQVVDYIEWVLEQMRMLALFLFISLLLTTILLSCYPFEPQSIVKAVFALILLGTVGALLYVMTDMNRNDVLSRIANTDVGRVTWDRTFIVNAVVMGIVPLLALISSEVPQLRNGLFFWITPLLRTIVGG
ncbi:MAG TPA: hypothetical protein VFT45_07025 [Longimicrobium sp.]|nr:hypothetical protein [Longimicrobium sp.]